MTSPSVMATSPPPTSNIGAMIGGMGGAFSVIIILIIIGIIVLAIVGAVCLQNRYFRYSWWMYAHSSLHNICHKTSCYCNCTCSLI
jgi:hypothetical protein